MMKVPTNSAMPAKTSSVVLKKPSPSSSESWFSSVISAPVSTSTPEAPSDATTASTRRASSSSLTPSAATMSISSNSLA